MSRGDALYQSYKNYPIKEINYHIIKTQQSYIEYSSEEKVARNYACISTILSFILICLKLEVEKNLNLSEFTD